MLLMGTVKQRYGLDFAAESNLGGPIVAAKFGLGDCKI